MIKIWVNFIIWVYQVFPKKFSYELFCREKISRSLAGVLFIILSIKLCVLCRKNCRRLTDFKKVFFQNDHIFHRSPRTLKKRPIWMKIGTRIPKIFIYINIKCRYVPAFWNSVFRYRKLAKSTASGSGKYSERKVCFLCYVNQRLIEMKRHRVPVQRSNSQYWLILSTEKNQVPELKIVSWTRLGVKTTKPQNSSSVIIFVSEIE